MTSQWPRWRLKATASRLFTQPFIQTQIKENIKAPRHWPLCGEFTGTGEFPAQRASYAENVSIWWRHHESLMMYSSRIKVKIQYNLLHKRAAMLVSHRVLWYLQNYLFYRWFIPFLIHFERLPLPSNKREWWAMHFFYETVAFISEWSLMECGIAWKCVLCFGQSY